MTSDRPLCQVHDNVVSGHIDWPKGGSADSAFGDDGSSSISKSAHSLISSLLTLPAVSRLGAGGAAEVRAHRFFEAVSWDDLLRHNTFLHPAAVDHRARDAPIASALRARRHGRPWRRQGNPTPR